MIFHKTVLIFCCVLACIQGERVRLEAKRLIKGKVLAKGYSISAKSLSHCLEYCNKRKKTCDGIVYHEVIQKCRLITKCAPAHQVDNTSSVVYYSRRPQIMESGYIYDSRTESCFGLLKSKVSYPKAEGICESQKAHLAVISMKKINEIVSSLLASSGEKWGWISNENIAHKEPIKPHGVSGNDVFPQRVFSPEVVQLRNSSKSCWGVNYKGQWGQFSCKNDTMVALCQVHQFKL